MVRIVSEESEPIAAEASGDAMAAGGMLDTGGVMLGEDLATNGVCARAGKPAVAATKATRHHNRFV